VGILYATMLCPEAEMGILFFFNKSRKAFSIYMTNFDTAGNNTSERAKSKIGHVYIT
jgi:hypothetical protein